MTELRTGIGMYDLSKHGSFENWISDIAKNCYEIRQVIPTEYTSLIGSLSLKKAVVIIGIEVPVGLPQDPYQNFDGSAQ